MTLDVWIAVVSIGAASVADPVKSFMDASSARCG
jgi:hypothetical protein